MERPASLPSSDDAPLLVALGLPCAAVGALFAWVHLDLGQAMAWPSCALVFAATLTIYGLDRWRDRGPGSKGWGWLVPLLILVQVGLLRSWWQRLSGSPWASLGFFCGGQALALGYAGIGVKGRGLKHLPGAKAIVVALGVSLACVGMVDAFSSHPAPLTFWGRGQVQSAAAYLLAITGCNAQLFDLRDLDRDAEAGVPSAAVLLGRRRAKFFAASWLLFWCGLSFALADRLEIAGWGSRVLGIYLGLLQIWASPFQLGASGYFLALDGALILPWLLALGLQALS